MPISSPLLQQSTLVRRCLFVFLLADARAVVAQFRYTPSCIFGNNRIRDGVTANADCQPDVPPPGLPPYATCVPDPLLFFNSDKGEQMAFGVCINEMFGPLLPPKSEDTSILRDWPGFEKLCWPASFDKCINTVNPFAPNRDCYDVLDAAEIAETSGVDPAFLAIGDHNNNPKNFSQLVPGTYLVKDVALEAWADSIENLGDTDSCMRIRGRMEGSHEDFFVDLSCNTTEGVSAIVSFDCPELVIHGVLKVVNASEAECIGIEAQIELTGAGLVDEANSTRARFANYTAEQRLTLVAEGEETGFITTRGIALISPGFNFPLGLLTFPTTVPPSCPSLLNERIFTITSGDVGTGSVLVTTASGFGYDPNDIERLFEVEEGSGRFANDFNKWCREAPPMNRRPPHELAGIKTPSPWFPLFKTGQSPAFPLFNARTVARYSVTSAFHPNKIADEFGISLDNLETGSSLDLILKAQLGDLLDQEAGVYVECRGLVLQTLPAGFSEPYLIPGGLKTGSIAAVGLDPEVGTLGDTVFVDVLINETDGSTTSLRDEGVVANLSQHNCFGANQTGQREINATVLVYERLEEGSRSSEDVIFHTECKIGFECFEACSGARLPVSSPAAVQSGTYELLDAPFQTIRSSYETISGYSAPPRSLLVGVGFQGDFLSLSEGGPAFGDKINTQLFDLLAAEGLQLSLPEVLLTSSMTLLKAEYTLLSLAEGEAATVETCFNAESRTRVTSKDLVHGPFWSTLGSRFEVFLSNSHYDQKYRSHPFRGPLLNDDELGLRSESQISVNVSADSSAIWNAAALFGRLGTFCKRPHPACGCNRTFCDGFFCDEIDEV
ncbi:unnamed protein product [Vitrella brassicaformis CCMP3155]|uniref:Uncharacterized protein n=1 Tax=Vitrella brassicaformis (strain CCMP3155) TaxID=1169540 RepID=A0A0G4GXU6_VITBC|nr:unnamed protein product [Vitrella brassicaformis CCMP3155]|eukprot:CEM35930.1 unnamed protein product [Vitrella brassicaformis CCMP3155]